MNTSSVSMDHCLTHTKSEHIHEKSLFRDGYFPDFSTQFFAGTENTLKMMKDLKIEWMLDYMTPANPSDTALAIVKGGAQRWQRLHYPYMETKPNEMLCNIFPEAIASMNRYMTEK